MKVALACQENPVSTIVPIVNPAPAPFFVESGPHLSVKIVLVGLESTTPTSWDSVRPPNPLAFP